MRYRCRQIVGAGLVALVVGAAAYGPTAALTASPRSGSALSGAGSTFIAPLMIGQWIPNYLTTNPSVPITYAAIGSGKGVSALTQGTVNFAASDALLTPAQEASARARCGGAILKIPATIGAVAVIYNMPGVRSGLKLSPATIAAIFRGTITTWNDKAIMATNPGVRLPPVGIQVVHRSDGSGTTYIFTHYLASVSAAWQHGPGAGATVSWPLGTGAKGSAGIVQTVTTRLGAIGYVDLAYAVQNNIDYATVQNAQGRFIKPGTGPASAAADAFASAMPPDLQQIIVNSPAANAYPVTGYSYIVLCSHQAGATGRALVDFVRYAVTAGQSTATALFYAPLPVSVQRLDTTALNTVTIAP